jgi:hypothetical protein
MRIGRYFLLELALLSLMILGSRAALVLHELGGHALPAWAMGARHFEVRMSALGGGYVRYRFPEGKGPGASGLILISMGGILVNLLTGMAAWIVTRRQKGRGLLHLALLFFGVGSVGGAVVYLCNGFYYGSGDPAGLAPYSEDISRVQWMWTLFVPAGAAVAWIAARQYADFLSGFMSQETVGRRVGGLLGTAGLAALAYGGLWLALHNPRVEGSTAQWRLDQEIQKEVARRTPAPPESGSLPDTDVSPPAGPTPTVKAEEVIDRVPPPIGPFVLFGAVAGSGILGLWGIRPRARDLESLPVLRVIGLVLLATGGVLAFLFEVLGRAG